MLHVPTLPRALCSHLSRPSVYLCRRFIPWRPILLAARSSSDAELGTAVEQHRHVFLREGWCTLQSTGDDGHHNSWTVRISFRFEDNGPKHASLRFFFYEIKTVTESRDILPTRKSKT